MFIPEAYSGLWYEFARSTPNIPWESGCKSATAFYELRDDDNVFNVINTCYGGPADSILYKTTGVAYATGEQYKLKVKFDNNRIGDYWILYTDYDNYSIVSGPEDSYVWILSRRKNVPKKDIRFLKNILLDSGIDPKRLIINEN